MTKDTDPTYVDPDGLRKLAKFVRESAKLIPNDGTLSPATWQGFLAGWEAACRTFEGLADDMDVSGE